MNLSQKQRYLTAPRHAEGKSAALVLETQLKKGFALAVLVMGMTGVHGQTNLNQNDITFFRLYASTTTVITAMSSQGVVTWSNATDGITTGQVQKATTLLGQSNWVDYVAFSVTGAVTQLRLMDPNPPLNMAYIPSGTFTMGDMSGDGDPYGGTPTHTVTLSAFYMDKNLVTKAQWDAVFTWATNNGYSFYHAGSGKAANHPVQTINWYDCVKWCNARSQKEGLTPAYYTDAGLTTVYKTNPVAPYVKWNTGCRLPTEAEWEYAARGGLNGKRFPWGDTITLNQANYYSVTIYSYEVSTTRGWNPNYQAGGEPYTSPVGSFAANGYGLYDMAGNVYEWCWDWYDSYSSGSQTDPRGPASGLYRSLRGGSWYDNPDCCRSASRVYSDPNDNGNIAGFRAVRPPGQ